MLVKSGCLMGKTVVSQLDKLIDADAGYEV